MSCAPFQLLQRLCLHHPRATITDWRWHLNFPYHSLSSIQSHANYIFISQTVKRGSLHSICFNEFIWGPIKVSFHQSSANLIVGFAVLVYEPTKKRSGSGSEHRKWYNRWALFYSFLPSNKRTCSCPTPTLLLILYTISIRLSVCRSSFHP